ncbi:MAG: UDP-N-acetylglucosamine 2-epimerase (non-hydrolyzing), partial [Candidatus Aminicenantales bacterium]
ILVSGARPNFMKVAPLVWELEKRRSGPASFPIRHLLVHTGQHYDREMMDVFFRDFELPEPDINLGVGPGSHAVQTARVMIRFERVCKKERPDLVVVVGDVNSTIACSLVAAKLGIGVAHVEAGLRSFDMTMPEEINRIMTDLISDFLFTSCPEANRNLAREGIPPGKVHYVGNIMIDSLARSRRRAEAMKVYREYGLKKGRYALLTLHRPSNVDRSDSLEDILSALRAVSEDIPVIFPVHPRTRKLLEKNGFVRSLDQDSRLILSKPLGYMEFLSLQMGARFVLTDSGGIQEETTALGIPCLTLRDNTERPVTVSVGTNRVIGSRKARIVRECRKILRGEGKAAGGVPDLWDGRTASRIIDILVKAQARKQGRP